MKEFLPMMLENETIRLRALEPEDLILLYNIENDSLLWRMGNHESPYSLYMLKQYLTSVTNDLYTDKQLRLIAERKSDQKAVGIIDLFDFSPRNRRAEVGIVVLPEFRRLGYGKSMLGLLMDYAFRQFHLHQFYAYVALDNPSAMHLFETLGFRQKHVLQDWLKTDEGFSDCCLFQKILSCKKE